MKREAKRSLRRAAAMTLALMLVTILTGCALAEPITVSSQNAFIELSTMYPALTVKAGDSLTFDLDIDNESGSSQDIELSVDEIPEGWSGSFSADGTQVSIVHVKNGESNGEVSFAADIPLDAEDGTYTIRLKAESENYSDTMDILLTVNAEEIGESSFSVEYPSQEGDADTEFSYSATLINNTLSEQSYSFAANAPSGWQVSFMPSGETTKVAALDVAARKSQGLDITVTPPANVDAGTYEIPCTATSASEKMETVLSVTITGSYDLTLSTASARLSLDAYANTESAIQLTLTNTGNTDLTNVNLTSTAPTGWTVRFASETIDLIEAGATIETTAYITPGEDAMSGDYEATITAKNSDASDKIELRVTVKTETKWGFVGIGVIVLLAAVVMGVMQKYGRRCAWQNRSLKSGS